ncbi:10157_t:CDS:2 [Racocetra fulgida]|uniref:10157_t:CDS:1 n=1 Tax=Racocetra fulgida TaxID=60492 RepID=A0A9N9BR35_9GLOM|nr:10157_t:CDS:2 [Racocetra fulgida]
MAANKIGNNRTSTQNEYKEETGKARSKWLYLNNMNEIFGNRENIKPDYLASNIAQARLKIENQKFVNELEERKEEREIECEKLNWEKERFVKEQEFKFKLEIDG